MRAKFEFCEVPAGLQPDSIVIKDLITPAEPSIAQDAGAVVQTLLRIAAKAGDEIGPNQPGIYYYSPDGTLIQLEHDGTEWLAVQPEATNDIPDSEELACNGRD